MVRRWNKRLYKSMMKNRKDRQREAHRLGNKRKMHDKEAKANQKKTPANDAEKFKIQELAGGVRQVKKIKVDA